MEMSFRASGSFLAAQDSAEPILDAIFPGPAKAKFPTDIPTVG